MALSEKPHLVLLSSPGLEHLIPIIELGKLFATLHGFRVTIFAVASLTSAAQSRMVGSAQGCHLVQLAQPDVSALIPPEATLSTRLLVLMREIRHTLRAAITRLEFPPSVLVVDVFGTESLSIAEELNIPKFLFFPSDAYSLAVFLYSPALGKTVEGEFVDQKDPFTIPGCWPLRPLEVVDPMRDRTTQGYREYLRMCSKIPEADGVLINTWEEFQPKLLAALRDTDLLGGIIKVPIFAIGPIIRPTAHPGPENELLNWLDHQPQESVLYVSFGSGGRLSCEQMRELASAPEARSYASYLKTGGEADTNGVDEYMPEGFLGRTVGKVVEDWASQVEILNHSSVGGFLSHCRWNSVLEGINGRVAMIAWPLYAEQRTNATLRTEEMGIAVRTKGLPEKGLVRRDEIAKLVRRIMVEDEGQEMRRRVKEIKRSAEKAWEETGSSYTALSLLSMYLHLQVGLQEVPTQYKPSSPVFTYKLKVLLYSV